MDFFLTYLCTDSAPFKAQGGLTTSSSFKFKALGSWYLQLVGTSWYPIASTQTSHHSFHLWRFPLLSCKLSCAIRLFPLVFFWLCAERVSDSFVTCIIENGSPSCRFFHNFVHCYFGWSGFRTHNVWAGVCYWFSLLG